MADNSWGFQASSDFQGEEPEFVRGEEKRLAELMERLRTRCTHTRSRSDSSKALRMSVVDKRHQSDVLEKTQLQKHLEALQKAFKVTNLPTMVERLESISKQLGLKFSYNPNGTDMFITISSELFYIQILIDCSAVVKMLKVSCNSELQYCEDLSKSISEGDFKDFESHLRGLTNLYHVPGDKKQRTKSFVALQALEADLNMLAQLQSTISSVSSYIHKSPLGILQPRNGGKAMKLVYFVSPYDLLNEKTKSSHPMTVEAIIENQVGHSLTVGIESSTPHKLQTSQLMTINKTYDGKGLPSFSNVNNCNGCNIPAVFVLRLDKPVPMSLSIIQKIKNETTQDFGHIGEVQPLVNLIVNQATKGKMEQYDSSKALNVTLPDQEHSYFVSGTNGSVDLNGMLVDKIPFTHPNHVPTIIMYLRHQVLFNTVVTSCVRMNAKQDPENFLTFEVTPLSLQNMSVTFEDPNVESIATAEFDLTDITNVKCKVYDVDEDSPCSSSYTNKVFQRCLSIPVTMRAIMKRITKNLQFGKPETAYLIPVNHVAMSKAGQERRFAFLAAHGYRCSVTSSIPWSSAAQTVETPNLPQQQKLFELPTETFEGNIDGFLEPPQPHPPPAAEGVETMGLDKISKNPMLASLLDQSQENNVTNSPTQQQQDSNRTVNNLVTTPPPQFNTTPSMLSQLLGNEQPKKKSGTTKKRKAWGSSSPVGRSPKRKPGEEEFYMKDYPNDLDNSNTMPFDVSVTSSPSLSSMHNTPTLTPNMTNLLEDMSQLPINPSESHVSKLAISVDNLIKQESSIKQEMPQRTVITPPMLYGEKKHPELEAMLSDKFKEEDPTNPFSSLVNAKNEDKKPETIKLRRTSSIDHIIESVASGSRSSPKEIKKEYNFDYVVSNSQDAPVFKSECSTVDMNSLKATVNIDKNDFESKFEKPKERKVSEVVVKMEVEEKPVEKEKISLKLNTKDGTAKAILIGGDGKRDSPQNVIDLSRKSHVRTYSAPERSIIDITSDSENSTSVSGSSSSHQSAPKKFKSSNSFSGKSEKKKHSSKHLDLESRKRKSEKKSEKDKNKKKKIYDFPDDDDNKKPKIKLTIPLKNKVSSKHGHNSSFKIKDQEKNVSSPHSQSKHSLSSHIRTISESRPGKLSVSHSGLSSSTKSKIKSSKVNRSKSESNALSVSGKKDSKLINTPMIRLKPIVMPSTSSTINVCTASTKTSTAGTKPVTTTSTGNSGGTVTSTGSSKIANKPALIKQRKGSLSDVINKLTQNKQVPGTPTYSGDGPPPKKEISRKDLQSERKESPTPPFKKDPIPEMKPHMSKKAHMEEIRKAIVSAGNKSSTPTKELQGFTKSFKKDKSKLAPPSSLGPIPKLNQTGSKSSPKNPHPSNRIPLISQSSKSDSHSKSSSGNKESVSTPPGNSKSNHIPPKLVNSLGNSTGNQGTGGGDAHHRSNEIQNSDSKPDTGILNKNGNTLPNAVSKVQHSNGQSKEKTSNVTDLNKQKLSKTNENQGRHFLDIVTNLGGSSEQKTKDDKQVNSSGSHQNNPNLSHQKSSDISRNTTDGNDQKDKNEDIPPIASPDGIVPIASPDQIASPDPDIPQIASPDMTGHHAIEKNSALGLDSNKNDSARVTKKEPVIIPVHKKERDKMLSDHGSDSKSSLPNCTASSVKIPSTSSHSEAINCTHNAVNALPKHSSSIPQNESPSSLSTTSSSSSTTKISPVTGQSQMKGSPSTSSSDGIKTTSSHGSHRSDSDSSSVSKSNSLNENKENAGSCFKAPTPKMLPPKVTEERTVTTSETEKTPDKNRIKPILSPRSDLGSPDGEGLVIDVSGSSKPFSPSQKVLDRSPSIPKSPMTLQPHSPADAQQIKSPRSPSPRKNPASKVSPVPSPVAVSSKSPKISNHSSPYTLDDDLMEAALGFG